LSYLNGDISPLGTLVLEIGITMMPNKRAMMRRRRGGSQEEEAENHLDGLHLYKPTTKLLSTV